MRKNDLIKRLNDIPGNPEIVLWNGYVQDYQAVDKTIDEIELVKHSKEFIETCLRHEGLEPSRAVVEAISNAQEWTFPNEFTNEAERKRWYGKNRKKVLILSGKPRGLKWFDRTGGVSY